MPRKFVGLKLTANELAFLDQLVEIGDFASRSSAIRGALTDWFFANGLKQEGRTAMALQRLASPPRSKRGSDRSKKR